MKKLVFLSTVASPHQVKYVPYLRKYYDAEFYFYTNKTSNKFWANIKLGDHAHLIPCIFRWHGRFLSLHVWSMLRKERPDILMLGSFSVPSNYLAYRWARRHGCKIVVQTERSRVMESGKPRPYDWKWKLLRWLYKDVDRVMVISKDAIPQFRDVFKFGDKVVWGQYPADVDKYFDIPCRSRKDAYTLIYPNRMTDIYDPLKAIDIFAEVLKRYPKTRLKMNAAGELRPQVERRIGELGIHAAVEFLDGLSDWEQLKDVYASCDIAYLPAKFSNGNYSITECQVAGLACVISTRVKGGVVDVFRKFNCGLAVEPEIPEFVKAISHYIEHPEEFCRIALINRELMRPFSMSGTAEKHHRILSSLFE